MVVELPANLPAGLRVLVAGGTKIINAPHVVDFCKELGRALIEEGTGGVRTVVMTGGSGDADRAVVAGATAAVGEAQGELHDRIVTFPPPEGLSATGSFSVTRVMRTTWSTRQERRFAMVAAADLVIAVAGGPGTQEEIVLARALGRPCLALPFTGGSARKAWDEDREGKTMRRPFGRWDSHLDRWEKVERAPPNPSGTSSRDR